MIRDNFVAEQHDDAFGMGAHQNHPAGGARIDAIAVVVGHDQTGRAGPNRLLDKSVEGAAKRHQTCALVLEDFPYRAILELGMPDSLGVGDALIFKPCIQLG